MVVRVRDGHVGSVAKAKGRAAYLAHGHTPEMAADLSSRADAHALEEAARPPTMEDRWGSVLDGFAAMVLAGDIDHSDALHEIEKERIRELEGPEKEWLAFAQRFVPKNALDWDGYAEVAEWAVESLDRHLGRMEAAISAHLDAAVTRHEAGNSGETDPERWADTAAALMLRGSMSPQEALDFYTEAATTHGWFNQPLRPSPPPPLNYVALPRPGMPDEIAKAIGMTPGSPATEDQLAHLMAGTKADGTALPTNGKGRPRDVAYLEFTFGPSKSVSVEYALSDPAARRAIVEANRKAIWGTVDAIEAAVGHRRSRAGDEKATIAAYAIEHANARPTLPLSDRDAGTGEDYTRFAELPVKGDPHLNTHIIVPNVLVDGQGGVGSLHQKALHGRMYEFAAVYNALLATELKRLGFAVTLRDGFAHVATVPDRMVELFSTNGQKIRQAAEEWARAQGISWEGLSDRAKAKVLEGAWAKVRQPKGADTGDFDEWRKRAEAVGYVHRTGIRPERARVPYADRIAQAAEIATPLLEKAFEGRAVIPASTLRTIVYRSMITTGMERWEEGRDVARLLVERGVRQEGRQTGLSWGNDAEGRKWIWTRMHEVQEAEYVRLARGAAADRGHPALRVDTGGLHPEQAAAAETLGRASSLAVAFGAAGSGKTTMLAPAVRAAQARGYEVWGLALANRQTGELVGTGIARDHAVAITVFLKRVAEGRIALGKESLVVVDEVALTGTRSGLELLRLRERHGFRMWMVGGPEQIQSIEAGSSVDLLQRALGKDAIPNITHTVRQEDPDSLAIADMLRRGEMAPALAAMHARHELRFVAGGEDATAAAAAVEWRALRDRTGEAPQVVVPTHRHIRVVSEKIREVNPDLGPVLATVLAAGGDGKAVDMEIRRGEVVRPYHRIWGKGEDGRRVLVADNGEPVTVLKANAEGLQVRNRRGDVAAFRWGALERYGTVRLSYGYAWTSIVAQGDTRDSYIGVLLEGSRQISGNTMYVYGSRHRQHVRLIVSDGAERQDCAAKRPPDATGPIRQADLLRNMVENLGAPATKDTAHRAAERMNRIRHAPAPREVPLAAIRHQIGQRSVRGVRQGL